jgi:hypothetical protein
MNMKLSLVFAALALVPATAFADDAPPPPPKGGYVVPQSVPFEGGSIPEGATIEKRPNLTLVGAGLGVFGAAYVPSVIAAIAACAPQKDCTSTGGAAWLYLPVIGPFITATQSTSDGGRALAVFDGGLQLTGAVIAVSGLIAQKKFVVWQDKSATLTVTPNLGGVSLTLTHL